MVVCGKQRNMHYVSRPLTHNNSHTSCHKTQKTRNKLLQPKPKVTASKYCLLWPVIYCRQPHGFKTCLLGRGFHTLIRNVSFPSPTDLGSHNLPSLGSTVLNGTLPVCGSNTNCNSLSSPLADIVRFGLLRIAVSLTVLKRVY